MAGGLGLALFLNAATLMAQDAPPAGGGGGRQRGGPGGNFDPAQMRERMLARYKEQLDVTSDDEWKLISSRIEKVTEARMAVGFGGMGRGMFGRGPGGPGGPGGQGGGPGGPGGGGRRGFGGEPSAEEEALQKAIDGKAGADELKTKLAAVRDARKAKEAALEKAQEDLRKILTARQEAVAVLNGLLK